LSFNIAVTRTSTLSEPAATTEFIAVNLISEALISPSKV